MPQLGKRLSVDTKLREVKQFAQQALWNIMAALDSMIHQRVDQTHQANNHCRPGEEYSHGDLVYLSTQNLSLPK
jgi:hypothetical protein